MSVDFFDCSTCGESVCDCGDYTQGCCYRYCSDKCAEEDKPVYDEDRDGRMVSCKYCRKEDFTDTELLNFLIRNSSRREVIEMYQLYLKENKE